MATIRKHGNKWQARIQRRGQQKVAKSFDSKADAEKWARAIEREMDLGVYVCRTPLETNTLGDLLARYSQEVSPIKKAGKQEQRRIGLIRKDSISKLALASLTSKAVAAFRDRRLAQPKAIGGKLTGGRITPRTVQLDLATLSVVLEWARKELGLPIANVVKDVRKPTPAKGRDRRLEGDEESRLTIALGNTGNPWMSPLLVLSLETGARRGELLKLKWADVDLGKRIALLRNTKNGTDRVIPLSSKAAKTLQELPRAIGGNVFPITANALNLAFRRAMVRAGITGLRWHDLRHEAVSRLFELGLNPMEVASISGHKTLAMLSRYTHLRAEELAKKLG